MVTSEVASADRTDDLPPERTLIAADSADLGEELAAYHAHFAPLVTRSKQRAWAAVYLRGRLTADTPRKNVEAMALPRFGAGPEAAEMVRALQPFVRDGGRDHAALLAAHRRLVGETLEEEEGVRISDGSDSPSRGPTRPAWPASGAGTPAGSGPSTGSAGRPVGFPRAHCFGPSTS